MSDYVVDTNVWVMVNETVAETSTDAESDCIEQCSNWLTAFAESQDRLVVDDDHKILTEYYNNVQPGTRGRRLLRRFLSQPIDRMVSVHIEYDGEYAKLPASVATLTTGVFRIGDRRLIAVALAHDPHPPIIDATDTDWEKAKEELQALGIIVQEICPGLIEVKMERYQ